MSSYRGHFGDLSPSDQADIAGWSEPPQPACELCGAEARIDPDASDAAGLWICTSCIETELQGACYERAHQAH